MENAKIAFMYYVAVVQLHKHSVTWLY